MGTKALIARACLVLTIAVPWLGLVAPGPLLVQVLLLATTLLAACHGWGAGVAWLCKRPVDAFVASAWGVAVLVLLAGGALAAGLPLQRPLVLGGVALHGVFLVTRFHELTEIGRRMLSRSTRRWWLVPAGLVVGVTIVHVLGSTGTRVWPYDDDGHFFAQVKRLLDTGTLDDGVGYLRGSQLGAHVTLASLGARIGGLACARLFEAIAFGLVLAVVVRRLAPKSALSCAWALLLVLVLASTWIAAPDAVAPLWLLALLVLAASSSAVDDSDGADDLIPLSLLVGAIGALRLEWLPFALIVGIGSLHPRQREGRVWRIGVLAAGMLIVLLPYVIVRLDAQAHVPAVMLPRRSLLLFGLPLGVVGGALVWILTRRLDSAVRWLPLGAVAAYACIASRLTTSSPYGFRYLWPIALVTLLVVALDLVRRTREAMVASVCVMSFAAIVLVRDGQAPHGWSARVGAALSNAGYLWATSSEPAENPYAAAMANVPRGASVAASVLSPERLDYSKHHYIDVRSPRAAGLASPSQTGAGYLLVEDARGTTLITLRP